MQLLLLPPLVTAFVGMRIIDREEWNGMLFLIIAMVRVVKTRWTHLGCGNRKTASE